MSPLVTYSLDGPVATLVMDDGKVNALSVRMFAELEAAFDRATAEQASVIVLAGREGVFSAGFDLRTLQGGGPDAAKMLIAGFELAERMLAFPRPIVVACTGHAFAMAVFLVLSADYRIGADGPFKISANEVAIGLTLPRSAIEISRQRLTPAHFNRALNNAEVYTPADSVAAGFLDRVVPAGNVREAAREMALNLSKLSLPAHAATKERTRKAALQALRAAIAADAEDFQAPSRFAAGLQKS
jgi:enoyl-CoA hydratase